MPAWIPGSYMIRDFARHIVEMSASAGGLDVLFHKIDKQTWQFSPCEGALTVSYQVYAWELSVRAAHLDTTHGYFNGTSVFLCPAGYEQSEFLVDIQPPGGGFSQSWRVATSMARAGALPHGFGTYRAQGYEDLIDHPVEMGEFSLKSFEAGGVLHELVITGSHRADMDRVVRDLAKICEQHIGLFEESPVTDRYVFLVMAVGEGYGGLEHRASCSLLCSRNDLPRRHEQEISDGYRDFLALCSHEYFHTWNVKRIKPAVFVPYDLSQEAHTVLLWAFEGITSYYDDLGLARSGVISTESYLELLGQTITRVLRGSGRTRQTLSESSFDAWTRFYKQDENAPNAIVSYYTKGTMAALALDLTMRRLTGDRRSLDDLMHLLWRRHGRTGEGVPENGVEVLAEEVAGISLKDFFDNALRSTEDLPLETLLADFGVEFHLRSAESQHDKGGKPADKNPSRAVLGVRSKPAEGGSLVTHVLDGGAAQIGGISAGDLVVAVDGLRTRGDSLEKQVAACQPGDSVSVHVFRNDELRAFQVELQNAPADTCVLSLKEDVPEATVKRREAWLAGARE